MLKVCSKCGVLKPLTSFNNKKSGRGGKASFCKACAVALSVAWAKENKAKRVVVCARWRDANAAHHSTYNKQWRARNPDKVRAYVEAFTKANHELAKSYKRKAAIRLTDGYVGALVFRNGERLTKDIPTELIQLKREQIRLQRLMRNFQQAINELKDPNHES